MHSRTQNDTRCAFQPLKMVDPSKAWDEYVQPSHRHFSRTPLTTTQGSVCAWRKKREPPCHLNALMWLTVCAAQEDCTCSKVKELLSALLFLSLSLLCPTSYAYLGFNLGQRPTTHADTHTHSSTHSGCVWIVVESTSSSSKGVI